MQAARDWLDRAVGAAPDPCYVCSRCGGGETPEWQALCRGCGEFDTLLWRSPSSGDSAVLAHIASAGALLMLPAPEAPDAASVPSPLPRSRASGLAPPSQWDK